MKSFSGNGPAPRLIKMLASANNTEVNKIHKYCDLKHFLILIYIAIKNTYLFIHLFIYLFIYSFINLFIFVIIVGYCSCSLHSST